MLPSESAGVVPQTFWNNLDSEVFDATSQSLLDSAGTFTAVKIVYDANDSWNSDGGTATTNEKLMKGIMKANPDPDLTPANNTDRMVFVITNLAAGAVYDVIVYSANNGVGGEMNVTVGATTYYIAQQNVFNGTFLQATSTTPIYTDANYARFNGVAASGGGTITITCIKNVVDPQITDGIGVPAIQIVQVSGANPPPNTETCSITANPQTTFAVVGGTATFTVGTQGPCKVQWTKNGSPIGGAIDPTLVYTPVLADDNAEIRAIVYNNVNTNTSAAATLYVDPATPPSLTAGFLRVERWTANMTGTSCQTIRDAIANLTPPDTTYIVAGPVIPDAGIDNFGARLSGWLKPDVTGYYDFFTRSDDSSQVFLNTVNTGTGTNALPDVNTELPICEETGCCEGFKEPVRTADGGFQPYETTTEPVFLEAGKYYGFVVLYKEGTGGDFVQVAWRRTNDTAALPAGSLRPIAPGNCYILASGAGTRSSITSQPANVTVEEGRPANFAVGVSTLPTAGQYGLQWRVNGANIVGANGGTYAIQATTLADNGNQYDVLAYTLGGVLTSSPPALLAVYADTNPPVPGASVIIKAGGAIEVGIGFNEAVNIADIVPGNFALIGGSGTIRFPTNSYGDYKGILFDTTGLVIGNTYTARVSNVRDTKGNAISASGVDAPFTVTTKMGWADTGTPKRPGQVVPTGVGGFDILNGGRTEWGSYDEATIAYTLKTNDFDVKVQVIYAEPGSQWTRVGLMARNDLNLLEDPNDRNLQDAGSTASAYAQTHINPNQTIWSSGRMDPTGLTPANTSPNNGHEQNQRLATGGATSGWGSTGESPVYPNEWLRLQRTGDTLRGFRGKDGVNWIDQGTTTLTTLQSYMYVGPFLAIETGNIWNSADHDIWGPFNPTFDRLFVAQFRNFGDISTVVPTPTLSIVRSGTDVIITYTGVLQSATVVTGPYTDVAGAASPYTTSASAAQRYFISRAP